MSEQPVSRLGSELLFSVPGEVRSSDPGLCDDCGASLGPELLFSVPGEVRSSDPGLCDDCVDLQPSGSFAGSVEDGQSCPSPRERTPKAGIGANSRVDGVDGQDLSVLHSAAAVSRSSRLRQAPAHRATPWWCPT